MEETSLAAQPSPRRREIVLAAKGIVAAEGADSLTMRRLAEVVGIRAPSLYKHIPGKQELESAVVEHCLGQLRTALAGARGAGDPIGGFAAQLVRFAHEDPHLYRFLSRRPLSPLLAADDRERAALVFVQGMVDLEVSTDLAAEALEGTWREGLQAFASPGVSARQTPAVVSSVRGPD
jgi:AcrR family transcriptional regulator